MVVLVGDENYTFETGGEPSPQWIGDFAEEVELTRTALERQTSLSEITQFDNQVSGEATLNAQIALVLSWLGIIIYLWFRFGNARWGLAAVVALVHDIFVARRVARGSASATGRSSAGIRQGASASAAGAVGVG